MRSVNPTTIRFTEADKALIAHIKERYGVTSTVEAVRLALRVAAQAVVSSSVDTAGHAQRPGDTRSDTTEGR